MSRNEMRRDEILQRWTQTYAPWISFDLEFNKDLDEQITQLGGFGGDGIYRICLTFRANPIVPQIVNEDPFLAVYHWYNGHFYRITHSIHHSVLPNNGSYEPIPEEEFMKYLRDTGKYWTVHFNTKDDLMRIIRRVANGSEEHAQKLTDRIFNAIPHQQKSD